MSNKKGFTLVEIIVVLIIIGVLAASALPSYNIFLQQGAANAAQNNLTSIYNAQKSLYFSSGSYYISGSCPDTLANINAGLSLNITDTNFTYCCNNTGGFQCVATNALNSNFTLTLTNASIILEGATNCATTSGSGCNPVCSSTNNTAYCP